MCLRPGKPPAQRHFGLAEAVPSIFPPPHTPAQEALETSVHGGQGGREGEGGDKSLWKEQSSGLGEGGGGAGGKPIPCITQGVTKPMAPG